MSYLLDKKTKRNNFIKILLIVIVLFILIYFRASIFRVLSSVSQTVFRPVLLLGNSVGNKFKGTSSFLYSKKSLYLQNENLKSELRELEARISNYNSILDENIKIKEILGRKNEKVILVLAGILSRPNQSPYDTLLIDAGTRQGITEGNLVFAHGNLPIGRVALVYPNSSKVILFSTPSEKTDVLVSLGRSPTGEASKDISMQLIGRGGGNFEMILLRDFNLEKGMEVVLPGITPHV